MIHYFKATDGVRTVFRSSTQTYRFASIAKGTISFSKTKGDHPCVEITKEEFKILNDLKIKRIEELAAANPAKPRWTYFPPTPSDSWVFNTVLFA